MVSGASVSGSMLRIIKSPPVCVRLHQGCMGLGDEPANGVNSIARSTKRFGGLPPVDGLPCIRLFSHIAHHHFLPSVSRIVTDLLAPKGIEPSTLHSRSPDGSRLLWRARSRRFCVHKRKGCQSVEALSPAWLWGNG